MAKAPTCVLYHHFTDQPDPYSDQLGVITPPEIFEAHLVYYAKNYDVIDLDTFLSGQLPKRPLLITFDDLYKSVLDIAAPMLKQYGFPSVLFVNPGLLTSNKLHFDNLISYFLNKQGREALDRCLGPGASECDSIGSLFVNFIPCLTLTDRENIKKSMLDVLQEKEEDIRKHFDAYLQPEDLKKFADYGVEIANHTSTHPFCRTLNQREIETELVESKKQIEDLCGYSVRAFSIPYGNELDATPKVVKALRESDHEGIFLTHDMHNLHRPADDIWYRFNLTNETPRQLYFKINVLPYLRAVKKWIFKFSYFRLYVLPVLRGVKNFIVRKPYLK